VPSIINLDLSKEKSLLVGGAATPFHKDTLSFFDVLSQRLIHESIGKPDMADALALGYWLRRSNISKMQLHFKQVQEVTNGIRVPIGQVFHVSPSNVEVLFAYSWALSTLCGCVSIVRVSSKHTELTRRIIGVIEQVATESAMMPTWAFISTPKSDVFTIGKLIEESDALVVWGAGG
jgi:acyl-CoA reductase-like NAD-dependent aldehyde dehydrogenase